MSFLRSFKNGTFFYEYLTFQQQLKIPYTFKVKYMNNTLAIDSSLVVKILFESVEMDIKIRASGF